MLVDFWSASESRFFADSSPGWFSGSPPSYVNSKAVVPRSSYAMDGEHGVYHGWCYHWFYWVAIGYNGRLRWVVQWSTWSRSPSRCEADISKLLWCRCHFSSRTYVGKVHVLSLAHTQYAFKASRKGKKENHIRRRLKSFYMLDLKRLYALEILAVSLMKVAIMDCDAL